MTRTVIVGASCSGKSTYAWSTRSDEDLVADYDRIAQALGNTEPHGASGDIGEATFRARQSVINTALELDGDSWIIHGKPTAEQIEGYLDADCVFVVMDPGLDTCLTRAEEDDRPEGTEAQIRAWYEDPPTFPKKAKVTTITGDGYPEARSKGATMTIRNGGARRPGNRYWGDAKLPSSKREFFDAITTPSPTGDGAIVTIRFYGPIDSWGSFWGISAQDVSTILDALPETVEQIILRINSQGGEVFEAVSILNMLRAHKASVMAVVDGLAASAASVLAVGCDETVMSPGTQMMIHAPSIFAYGNAEDLRKEAGILDGVQASLVEIYTAKAGEQQWDELLAEDTFLTAQATVDLGLADRIAVIPDAGEAATAGAGDGMVVIELDPDEEVAATATRRAAFAAALKTPVSSESGNPNKKEEITMPKSDAFLAGVRERLGVTDANATEEAVMTALEDALTTPNAETAVPEGAIVVDETAYKALQADAAAGRQAMDVIDASRRDQVIAEALKAGRITAESKDKWRAQLDKDEVGITAIIQSMPENKVPVVEIGHSDTLTSADDALYGEIYQKEA